MWRRDQIPVVMECANCSRHARDRRGALSETVTTVSLSTLPRLSLLFRQCCLCLRVGSGEADAWGKGEGGRCDWLHWLTVRWRNQMTWHLDDYRCSEQHKWGNSSENTVKHRDGGVGSVVANRRGNGESSVVVTTVHDNRQLSIRPFVKLKTNSIFYQWQWNIVDISKLVIQSFKGIKCGQYLVLSEAAVAQTSHQFQLFNGEQELATIHRQLHHSLTSSAPCNKTEPDTTETDINCWLPSICSLAFICTR